MFPEETAQISDERNILLRISTLRKKITNLRLTNVHKLFFFHFFKYILSVNKDSMTVLKNSSNQNSADCCVKYSAIKMYRDLFLIKILVLGLLCKSDKFVTATTEYDDDGSGTAKTFWANRPLAIIIELRESLLDNVRILWEKENETTFPVHNFVLTTFDSRGLQERLTFNETEKFLQSVRDLRPSYYDREEFKPTLHAINELLENLSDGNILVFAMTRPSDEDFSEVLEDSLVKKKCQLSVLWSGSKKTNDYYQLKNLAIKSGGKFGFLNDNNDIENEDIELISDVTEETFEQIRFPQQQKEPEVGDVPLSQRGADQQIYQKIAVPLIIEVASGTSLESRPGAPTQVPFTVKNNLNRPLLVLFNAKFNSIIQVVQPRQAILQPGISNTVTVTVQPIGVSQASAVGTVTLTGIFDNIPISRSALISLTPQDIKDRTDPKMYYKYEGDCSNYREPQNCENGHWGIQATIHDEDSGLLKILSEPYGLLFQSEFIAGTKTPVQVSYSATCCQPIVQIWAEDLKGNYVRKSFDVFNQTLLAGEIATIVLGILLLLFIIIGIIVAVVLVKRRNRRNLIIPRPRTESR